MVLYNWLAQVKGDVLLQQWRCLVSGLRLGEEGIQSKKMQLEVY